MKMRLKLNRFLILFLLTVTFSFYFFLMTSSVYAFPTPFPLTWKQKSSPEFSPYGVAVSKRPDWVRYEARDKIYRLLSEAGVKWIRLMLIPEFDWAEIEPKKGVWNWDELDKEIQLIGNYGMEILGTIGPPCPQGQEQAKCQQRMPDWWDGNEGDYKEFVRQLVSRYSSPIGGKRRIKYWQTFNEWNGQDTVFTPKYFTRYMKIISQVLKENSSELMLSAAFAGWPMIKEANGELGKIDKAFSSPLSAGQYHDFLAFHKYADYKQMDNRNAPFIEALKAMAKIKFNPEYNIADKPVWVTEGGYGCNLTPGTVCNSDGEKLQADDLQKRYWIAFHPSNYGVDSRLKIDKVFWMKDISANTGWETYEWGTSGLFNWENDYEPRPAYYAYKEMALWYRPPGKVGLISPADNSTFANNRPLFKWEEPTDFGSEGFRRYVIQIDDDQYFSSPIILEQSNPWGFGYTTSSQYQVGIDIPNGTYYWRVKVEDQKGNFSSWSQAWQFTISGAIQLQSGWNQITWSDISGYNAKTALEDIDSDCGAGTVVAISRKRKDWWEGYLKNFGGKNFTLNTGKSYYLNVIRDCTWIP